MSPSTRRRRRVETVPFERFREAGRDPVIELRAEVSEVTLEERDELIGRTIAGKYFIEEELGAGSCGMVVRARQFALEKDVAIKILHRSMSRDGVIVERFHREARAASRLDHPSSIRVVDFGLEPDGLLYLVTEYVAGRDLLTLMNTEPFTPRRIAIVLGQVLAALAVAHHQGIIHRDLKPENILVVPGVSDDGEAIDVVKVCDFGIATLASRDDDAPLPRVTGHGLVVGTPEYMSPEQARGERLDGRSDLYSVGVVLYQLLTGRVPFEGEAPLATAVKHITEPVRPPSTIVPTVDPVLERICLRALAKDRDDRYPSAREMRAELRTVLSARAPVGGGAPGDHLTSNEIQVMAAEATASLPVRPLVTPRARLAAGAIAIGMTLGGTVATLRRPPEPTQSAPAAASPVAAPRLDPLENPLAAPSASPSPSASKPPWRPIRPKRSPHLH